MTVVSGSATIASASAVHGGRPETGSQSKARPLGGVAISDGAVRMDASLARAIVRIQEAGDVAAKPVASDVIRAAGPHGRFVDAVQALRLTKAEASRLTPTRIAELKEAAKEVFSVATGIPRAQSPIEIFEEQRLRDIDLRRDVTITGQQDNVSDSNDPVTGVEDPQTSGQIADADKAKPELPDRVIVPEAEFAGARDGQRHPDAARSDFASDATTGEQALLTASGPAPSATGDAGRPSTD